MKQNAILIVTSLLSILLLTLHITDDIVRGISKAESSNTALIVLVVLLYGTLVLAERRSGHVIMLLVWTLWALGGLGGVTFILSARGLWSLRRGDGSS